MLLFKKSLELLCNPLCILFLLILTCLVMLWKKEQVGRVRLLLAIACGFLLLIGTQWLPWYITRYLENLYPVVQEVEPEVKWIVVLGGGHNQLPAMPENNLLSSASIKRLVEGLRLLLAAPNAHLVLSGGGENYLITEASLMRQLGLWMSVPKQKMVLEFGSQNTEDQAKAIKSLVHNDLFYLVTSAVHMPRAMFLCHQQGLHPIAAPTDFTSFGGDRHLERWIIPNIYNAFYLTIASHELLGRLWAELHSKE